MESDDPLTEKIIGLRNRGASMSGRRLLEDTYHTALCWNLQNRELLSSGNRCISIDTTAVGWSVSRPIHRRTEDVVEIKSVLKSNRVHSANVDVSVGSRTWTLDRY